MNKNQALTKIDNYLEYNISDIKEESDFIDLLLDKFSELLKYIGKIGYEWLKKKYLIGKYSYELKGRLNAYKKMNNEYKNIESFLVVIDTGNYTDEEYKLFVQHLKQLNKLCSTFKSIFPDLDYLNPLQAIYNYNTIKDYMYVLSGKYRFNVK